METYLVYSGGSGPKSGGLVTLVKILNCNIKNILVQLKFIYLPIPIRFYGQREKSYKITSRYSRLLDIEVVRVQYHSHLQTSNNECHTTFP